MNEDLSKAYKERNDLVLDYQHKINNIRNSFATKIGILEKERETLKEKLEKGRKYWKEEQESLWKCNNDAVKTSKGYEKRIIDLQRDITALYKKIETMNESQKFYRDAVEELGNKI